MIFDRFFRPKHQHPDPQQRINALASLSPKEEGHRTILRDLAFNDGDPDVAWSALEQLGDLALLIKAMQTSSHTSIRDRARGRVVEQFCSPQLSSEPESRLETFLVELSDKELQEELLFSSPLVMRSAELTLRVLKRLDKPAIQRKLFKHCIHESVLVYLVNQQTTSKQLKSLKRDQMPTAVADAIAAKIAKCERVEAFVSSAQDELKFLNSRLNYLATVADYERIKRQNTEIKEAFTAWFEQFQEARSMFKQHELVQLDEAVARFHQLAEQVRVQEDEQYPQFVRVQRINELTEQLASCNEQVNYFASQCEHFHAEVGSAQQWECEFTASQKVLDTALTEQQKVLETLASELITAAQKQTYRLLQQQITTLRQALSNAQEQLEASLEQQAHSGKLNGIIDTHSDENDGLDEPEAPSECDKLGTNTTEQGQIAATGAIEKSVLKSLHKIRFLIDKGQYRAAIRRFDSLPVEAKSLGGYTAVAEKIEELRSLQDFIGIPRKKALLSEAATLVRLPMTTVAERAAEVKRLRQEWTSLGNTTDSNDERWNTEFNEYLEHAFAPCRQAYEIAKQERMVNKKLRDDLLQQLTTLDEQASEIDNSLIKRFFQMQQAWRDCGPVDIEVREALQVEYQRLVDSIKSKINEFWAVNRQAKQSLINKAEALHEVEIETAIDQAKALQSQWKLIGQCARKHEHSLWRAFDQAIQMQFNRLNEQRKAKQEQELRRYHDIEQQRLTIEQQIDAVGTRAELTEVESALRAFDEQVVSLPVGKQKSVSISLDQLRKAIQAKYIQLSKEKRLAELHGLLNGIEQGAIDQSAISTEQRCITESSLSSGSGTSNRLFEPQSRLAQTILIELETGVQPLEEASPEESQLRRDVQLERMRRRLERGEQGLGLEQLVEQWAAFGPISEPEQPLFERLKRAVLHAV